MKQDNSEPLLAHQLAFRICTQPPTTNSSFFYLHFADISLQIKDEATVLETFNYNDLIGFNHQLISEEIYKIQLNNYPKRKKIFRSTKRYIEQFTFWINITQHQFSSFKITLLRAITNRNITNTEQSLKMLIYLNPNAGSNSRTHFQKVRQFTSLSNFTFDLVETTHRGHCQQHLATVNPMQYQAVIIISGDGLMHEFANSQACGKIPVSHVPGGSGNAFAKTQMTLANQQCTDQSAIFLVVKGRIKKMNLIKMQLQKIERPIYSFLSLQWAFLADIDMNSEFLRIFGGLRFEIYSVYRVVALRRYNGKLTYSTTCSQLPPLNQQIVEPTYKTIETNFLNAIFPSIPYISDKYEFAPLLKVEDEAVDMQFTTEQQGRWQLIKYLLSSQTGDHFDKQKKCQKQGYNFGYGKVKSYRLQPLGQGQERGIFGIDGEHYEAQRMQASISDKKLITFV